MRSDPIHATRPDETTDEALAMMRQFQVRRLPVIGADGTLKGIVSLNDIVLAAPQNDGPAPADIVSTLAAICARQPIGAVAARVYPTTRKRAVAPN
jgi:CBS domain-containing protein